MKKTLTALIVVGILTVGVLSFNVIATHDSLANEDGIGFITSTNQPWPGPNHD